MKGASGRTTGGCGSASSASETKLPNSSYDDDDDNTEAPNDDDNVDKVGGGRYRIQDS